MWEGQISFFLFVHDHFHSVIGRSLRSGWLIRADRPVRRSQSRAMHTTNTQYSRHTTLTYCGTCIGSRLPRRCLRAGCILTWRRGRKRETSSVGTFACNWKRDTMRSWHRHTLALRVSRCNISRMKMEGEEEKEERSDFLFPHKWDWAEPFFEWKTCSNWSGEKMGAKHLSMIYEFPWHWIFVDFLSKKRAIVKT